MKQVSGRRRAYPLLPYLALIFIAGLWLAKQARAPETTLAASRGVAGHVSDEQGEPVVHVQLRLYVDQEAERAGYKITFRKFFAGWSPGHGNHHSHRCLWLIIHFL
jgi:hypothetical protein